MKKTVFGMALALGLLAASSAFADPTYVEKNVGQDQNVEFKDDVMSAPGLGAGGDQIRVRPSAVRMMLLRPRTNFIMQMLKSVENL